MIVINTYEFIDIMCALLEYWLANPQNKTCKKMLDFLQQCDETHRRVITIGIKD